MLARLKNKTGACKSSHLSSKSAAQRSCLRLAGRVAIVFLKTLKLLAQLTMSNKDEGKRTEKTVSVLFAIADLMEVMKGSGQGLMQQLATAVAASQVSRSSQTVGTRFRDQLKDLITRLDQ